MIHKQQLNLRELFLRHQGKLKVILVYHHKSVIYLIIKILSSPNDLAILTVIKFLEYSIPFLNVVGP